MSENGHCAGAKILSMGYDEKGLATSSFGGLVTVLGANKRECCNPAIISGQIGCGRSIRPLLSLVENWRESDRATQAETDRCLVINR